MNLWKRWLCAALMAGTAATPAIAQRNRPTGYYNGMRRGYAGGYSDVYDHRRYDNREEYQRTHSGIGPGKGALIGGAGGAVLGALFGGGLKGALIGGGAGAGVGAIAGKIHQDNQRQDWRDLRDDPYRR